jgi:FkbM family methyltransferase
MTKLKHTIDKLKEELSKEDFISSIYENYHSKIFQYSEYLKETNIKKIEISDENVLFYLRDIDLRMVCNEKDFRSTPIETLNYSYYEKEDSKMITEIFDPKMNFFDIGANLGIYSLRLSMLFKESNSFAFEPIKSTYSLLEKNVKLNSLDNISTYNFGFSNKEETKNFFFYPEGTGNASSKNVSDKEDILEVECKLKKLDDFIKNFPSKPDFIKCDVEGAELFVFEGGVSTIKEYKPIVFSEILRKWSRKFDYNPNDIFDLFYDIGYKSYFPISGKLHPFGYMDEETTATNFFFLHEKNHQKIIKKFELV